MALPQSNLFASLERLMVTGIRSPTRSAIQGSVGPHVIAATKLLSFNLKDNLLYVSPDKLVGASPSDMGGDVMDQGEASLAKDAAKCMYFGNQLNLLYA